MASIFVAALAYVVVLAPVVIPYGLVLATALLLIVVIALPAIASGLAVKTRSRLGDKAAKEGLEIPLVEADCRHFSLDRLFELIICPFSAMQHMHDRASLEAFLDRVRAHLTPGAPFIFDVFNPNVEVLARGAGERFPVFTYTEEESGQEIFVEEATDYDDAAQVSHITWYCTGGGSDEVREEEIHLRCFYPQELDMLLYYNRFEILVKLGTFSGEPFASGLGRQIVVCRPV